MEFPIEKLRRAGHAKVGGGAGPCVFFRPRYQICPNRVPLDITQGDPKMPLVEWARVETVLPEMADAVAARVEVERVSAVRATSRFLLVEAALGYMPVLLGSLSMWLCLKARAKSTHKALVLT
jgi:hypothetical protein